MKKYLFLLTAFLFLTNVAAQKNFRNLLIGTYTNSCDSKGIYSYDFDIDTGIFKSKQSSPKTTNPSYLTVSADNKFIYSVNEDGDKSSISAFKFDSKSGKIEFINRQSSQGADPCFIINDTKNIIAANYSGGNIAVFGKSPDGSITKPKQVIQHFGKSSNAKRQEKPHVHQVQFSPDNRFVLANDLGTDRIYLYRYFPDAANEILVLNDTIPMKTGSGPRHLTFSPDGKMVYVLQELDGTITAFSFTNGKFRRIQETSVVLPNATGEIGAADIHISEDRKFLYATNRGDANTISTFAIDIKGKLTLKQTIASGGKGPRNFTIAPGGKFVLVAHQNSNDVTIFSRNATTGELTNTGKKLELCAPVCLVFTPEK